MIQINVFRAAENKLFCRRFMAANAKVLAHHQLQSITSCKRDWSSDIHTYVAAAQCTNSGHILGGIRIQVTSNHLLLPLEEAIGHLDPKVSDKISDYASEGVVAELCGFWKRIDVIKNTLLAENLAISALAFCSQLPVNTLLTLASPYILRMAYSAGFRTEKTLGNNGEFIYPKINHRATLLSMDPLKLDYALPSFKNRIEEIRIKKKFRKEEILWGKKVSFQYDLDSWACAEMFVR